MKKGYSKRQPSGCGYTLAAIVVFVLALIAVLMSGCHSSSHPVPIEYKAEQLPDSVHLVPIGDVETFTQTSIMYKGKAVGFLEVDAFDRWKISAIYDSTGAIHGLVDILKERSSIIDTLFQELEAVRGHLKSMHDTGKCPFGEQYFEPVVTDSFTLISGCYTKEEHIRELTSGDRPRLEIQ